MKATMKSAVAGFSARRMVKQYIEMFYSGSIKNAMKNSLCPLGETNRPFQGY